MLRHRIVHLRRRRSPILGMWQENIDAVLISHLHYDHLDLPSLRRLGRQIRLIVPVGAGALLRQHGFTKIEELRAGERTSVAGVPVTATTALHSGARPARPHGRVPGLHRRRREAAYHFAGDTDLFPEMEQMAGAVDVGLIRCGVGPTLGTGHMDPTAPPKRASSSPQVAIPIHWGTLYPLAIHRLTKAFLIDPPRLQRIHDSPGAAGRCPHSPTWRALRVVARRLPPSTRNVWTQFED